MIIEKILIYAAILLALAAPTAFIIILARAVMKATARNPSTATKVFWGMVLLLICVEGIAITSIVMVFRLFVY